MSRPRTTLGELPPGTLFETEAVASEGESLDNLSRLCVRYGRGQAGLPPLGGR